MGERTTPMGVEILARALFAAGQATQVIAIELPQSHAMMHLDTVMTMIDRGMFVLYPYLDRRLRSWTVTPATASQASCASPATTDLWDTIAEALGRSTRSPC